MIFGQLVMPARAAGPPPGGLGSWKPPSKDNFTDLFFRKPNYGDLFCHLINQIRCLIFAVKDSIRSWRTLQGFLKDSLRTHRESRNLSWIQEPITNPKTHQNSRRLSWFQEPIVNPGTHRECKNPSLIQEPILNPWKNIVRICGFWILNLW